MHFALPESLDFLHKTTHKATPRPARETVMPPCYFTMADAQGLRSLLLQPSRHFIEIGPRALLEESLAHIHSATPDFALSLSSATAFNETLAGITALSLEDRFNLPGSARMPLRTCLQEAVTNAVVHGNLGLKNPRNSPTGYDEYYETIVAMLAQEAHSLRRVSIYAWYTDQRVKISIRDQGNGFPDKNIVDRVPDTTSRYGRGLFLISSMTECVWIEKDNRTLSMIFVY